MMDIFNGMHCVEVPELRQKPDEPVPKIWSRTRKGAESLARKAIKERIKTKTIREMDESKFKSLKEIGER